MLGAQMELYVAPIQSRLPIADMHALADICMSAWHDRRGRIGTVEGVLEVLRDSGILRRSYTGLICRGPGRFELDVLPECKQAAYDTPGTFDCIFHPEADLKNWLEYSLGEEPEPREIVAFLALPRAADQGPHVDNTAASRADYLTQFIGVQPGPRNAGATRFFRNTAELLPAERDAICRRLKRNPDSVEGETVRLDLGQWATFGLHTVHHGTANTGLEHIRIVCSVLWARKNAPDLPQNRVMNPMPRLRQRTALVSEVICTGAPSLVLCEYALHGL